MLRSRLKTCHQIRRPACATIVGVLPINDPAVEAVGAQICATLLDRAVLAWPIVGPDNLPADTDGDICGCEEEIANGNANTARIAGLHGSRE